MNTINISKKAAKNLLQKQIQLGNALLNKCMPALDKDGYDDLLDEADSWFTNTSTTLRQIFTDETISSKFIDGNGAGLPNPDATITEKTLELKRDIKKHIQKLNSLSESLESNLYSRSVDPEDKKTKWSFAQAVIIALISAAVGLAGYSLPHKADPEQKQGLENISLEGKWKYICSSFDGSYQHGGRFYVEKASDGYLVLHGERMWKDTKDLKTNIWTCRNFKQSDFLQWHTNWIFVKNSSQIYFEYEIPMQTNTATGYCSGEIYPEHNHVQSVQGNFYVLNNVPILTGQIYFKKVSDAEFNSMNTLPKNH